MKIAINTTSLDGPWGGGNRFVKSLAAAARERGHAVVFALDDDVDLVLMIDPRRRNPQLTFTPGRMLSFLARRPGAVVVHRINECDERKGTRDMNLRLRLANYAADHTVFIASWLKDLRVWRRETPASVILNGADEAIFRRDTAARWDGAAPLRLVTHHWGAHALKGWDVYGLLGVLTGQESWRGRLVLTFIGNAPSADCPGITFVSPLDGAALAAALADNHAYVTASVNEPAGMHHVEGALVGLPLLYRRSGALPEYCDGFGVGFDGPDDCPAALSDLMADYPRLRAAMGGYANTAARMNAAYIDLFEHLHADRAAIGRHRRLWRDPAAALAARLMP